MSIQITKEDFIHMAIEEGVILGSQAFVESIEEDLQRTVLMEQNAVNGDQILEAMIQNTLDGRFQEAVQENLQEMSIKRQLLFN